MRSGSRAVFKLIARLAFAAFLTVGGVQAVYLSLRSLGAAGRTLGETHLETRQRLFGAPYADGIERARELIAPGEAYVLVDAGDFQQAARFWVRYDLAPRRARFLGFVHELRRRRTGLRRRWPREARYAVVARPHYEAALVLSRAEFFSWVEASRAPR